MTSRIHDQMVKREGLWPPGHMIRWLRGRGYDLQVT